MYFAARTLRLLALIVWIGGIVLFGAVFAPTAAHALPRNELSPVIGPSLAKLHVISFGCGIALLVALRILSKRAFQPAAQVVLTLAMIVFTLASNYFILSPMEHDRAAAGGDISALTPDSPLRRDFDARHAWSTRTEGAVLLCGVVLTLLVAAEASPLNE